MAVHWIAGGVTYSVYMITPQAHLQEDIEDDT